MDTAVALVQAYLHVNGYFTVVEYPVLEAFRAGPARTVTDLDVLAVRFPHAGSDPIRRRGPGRMLERPGVPDAILGCPSDHADMIVGEVKEGKARFNPTTRDPAVLAAALTRFGCCPLERSADIAQRLLSDGRATTPAGHIVRMVAFGAAPETATERQATIVPMHHVVEFLREYLREHWDVLRHAQIKDNTFGLLALIEKWGTATSKKSARHESHPAAR